MYTVKHDEIGMYAFIVTYHWVLIITRKIPQILLKRHSSEEIIKKPTTLRVDKIWFI